MQAKLKTRSELTGRYVKLAETRCFRQTFCLFPLKTRNILSSRWSKTPQKRHDANCPCVATIFAPGLTLVATSIAVRRVIDGSRFKYLATEIPRSVYGREPSASCHLAVVPGRRHWMTSRKVVTTRMEKMGHHALWAERRKYFHKDQKVKPGKQHAAWDFLEI